MKPLKQELDELLGMLPQDMREKVDAAIKATFLEKIAQAVKVAVLGERIRAADYCDRRAAVLLPGEPEMETKSIGLGWTHDGHKIREDRFDLAYCAWAIRRGDHVPWKERK